MIKETPIFTTGTYETPCDLFKQIKIGSVSCVGHSEIPSIKKCKYCVSFKQENTYFLPILKETVAIVSEVQCNRPGAQLLIF